MAADVSSPTLARAAGRRYGYLPRRDEAPNDQRNNRYQADSDGLGPPRIGIPHGEAQVRESETPSSSTRGNAKSSGEVGLPTRMVPGGPHRGGIAAYQRQPALDPADFRSTPRPRPAQVMRPHAPDAYGEAQDRSRLRSRMRRGHSAFSVERSSMTGSMTASSFLAPATLHIA